MFELNFTPEEIKELVDRAVVAAKGYLNSQNYNDGEILLRQTLRVDPKCEYALRMLAQLLLSTNRNNDAIEIYEQLLELKPEDFESLNNLALCYSSIGEKVKALTNFKKCTELYPDNPASHSNLALHYKENGNAIEAQATYLNGIKRLPNSHDLHFNYGVLLAENKRLDEATQEYEEAIKIKPNFYLAHFNLGLINLLLGNYEKGWTEYEWRFNNPVFKKFKERFIGEEWNGESGEGKTILVYNEQGSGDAIMFARYLPELKRHGFTVILEVVTELVDLMSQCKGVDKVIPQRSKNIPNYDYHVSICSLPLKLKTFKPFWNGIYISPTGAVPEKAFEDYEKFTKVGICWAGNPVHKHDKVRSCMLKDFKPLFSIIGLKLFSLQKDLRPRFWAGDGVVDLTEECKGAGVVDISDLLIDFNYTAAIMKCMNCIITVDTAVAHLAGAMGLNCYLLLPEMPDWRWGLKLESTKWYPTIKLMRFNTHEKSLRQVAYEIKHIIK